MNNHTKSAFVKAAGYSIQINRFFETGRVGQYKPDVSFIMNGPYETVSKHRCVVRIESDYFTMSVPEAKALWLHIGKALGLNDWKLGHLLRSVPEEKRAID